MPTTSPPSSKGGRSPSSPRPRLAPVTLISADLAGRLKSASALVGIPDTDLIRIGLSRLLTGIERDGFLRAGPRAEQREAGCRGTHHAVLMKTALVITPVRLLTEEEKARLRARCRLEGISPRSFVSHVLRRALAAGSEAGAAAPEPR